MVRASESLQLYLDTTVPNYVFANDSPNRREITRRFMAMRRSYGIACYISDVVLEEISRAPEFKRANLLEVLSGIPVLTVTKESELLAREYIRNKILPQSSLNDARHIAIASLNGMHALLSWNFGHLVNVRRIRAIHELHDRLGLPMMEIVTPEEVIP